MRFYTGQHRFYCGIDLHAHTMAVCILDAAGEIVLERNRAASPEVLLETIAPYRDGLVVACECLFTWYWLADRCAKQKLAFVLGHALYMKAIHGGKAKNDRIDAHKIAVLLRGGMLPQAYVYPPGMRETRDLLRRRLHLVRKRGQLLAHLQNLTHAYQRGAFEKRIAYPSNRSGVISHFAGEPMVQANAALDLSLLDHYDKMLVALELRLVTQARREAPSGFHLLRSIPGIGKVLAMTIVYDLHDVGRFERVQQFASYARLVKCAKESAGKRKGTGGAKMGNVHLKWAFSEAAVLFVRHSSEAKALVARLTQRHGKGKALSILAHKLGRAAYYVLLREKPFDAAKFFAHA
ncbi:MAG: IS110 family transposase, partial [Myxococcota bacterium]